MLKLETYISYHLRGDYPQSPNSQAKWQSNMTVILFVATE